jgi:hypothetical protein
MKNQLTIIVVCAVLLQVGNANADANSTQGNPAAQAALNVANRQVDTSNDSNDNNHWRGMYDINPQPVANTAINQVTQQSAAITANLVQGATNNTPVVTPPDPCLANPMLCAPPDPCIADPMLCGP